MSGRLKKQAMASDSSRYSLSRASRQSSYEQSKIPHSQSRAKERETLGRTKPVSRLRSASMHSSASNLYQTASASSLDLRATSSQATLRRTASVSSLRTPTKTPTKATQQPIEQTRRAAIAENVQKVLRALQEDNAFYNKLALSNGLKFMTAKQFIDIVGYFIQFISGKNLITGRQIDYETDVLNFIKSIHYPWLLNKSWFRTPTAPHAYHECVALLAWLSDFVSFGVDSIAGESMDKVIMSNSDFPSAEFAKMFSAKVMDGFYLWGNEKDDDFAKMKLMLTNQYISKHMHDKIQTAEEALAHINELKKYCYETRKVECYVKNEKRFAAVEEQYFDCERKAKELENICTARADELASVEIAYGVKREKIETKQKIIENLMATIKSQKRSASEMHELNIKLTVVKNSIESMKQEISTIKNDGISNQVKLARLIQQKADATAQLNKIFYKISQVLVKSKLKMPLNELYVNPNSDLNEIHANRNKLERLLNYVQDSKRQRDSDLDSVDTALRSRILHEKQLTENAQKGLDTLAKYTNMIHKIDAEITEKSREATCLLDELMGSGEQLQLARNKVTEDIRNTNEKCVEVKRQSQQILEAGEKRAMELIAMKEKILENLHKAIECVDSIQSNEENDE